MLKKGVLINSKDYIEESEYNIGGKDKKEEKIYIGENASLIKN